jgi:hypothetical protein
MRRGFIMALLVLCVSSWTAAAVSLCDYRSPKTDLSSLMVNFSYQYHNDPYGLESRDVNQGQFGVDYERLFDSPSYGFDISFQNTMIISSEDKTSYQIMSDGNYKRYFSTDANHFAYAGAVLRSSSSFQKLGLAFNVGVGTGRFADVTPMAKATRIDDYLVARGSISAHLHEVDLRSVALDIGSSATYESQATLLADIQNTIEGSGLVRWEGLDALDIYEITRFVQEQGLSRYCGWDLKIGLGYELIDPSGGSNDLLFSGGFNYALSTTPKEQLLLQGSFSGSPDILSTHRVDLTGSYNYLISDFLSAAAGYYFSRETWAGEPVDTHRMSLDLTLSPVDTAHVVAGLVLEYKPYFLEWSVDLQLSVQMGLL